MFETNSQKILIKKEQLQQWCVMIAVPCYDQQVTEPFMMSLINTIIYFKEIGLKFSICTISDSLVSRARNSLAAKFMGNPLYTHMMFIDCDLSFNRESILKMLWHDKDIVVGSYPIKEINWEKIKEASKMDIATDKLMQEGTRYVVHMTNSSEAQLEVEKGAISVYDAGTGFMLIKRQVFEKMFKKYKKLKYIDDTGSTEGAENEFTYALFNSYIDSDSRFLSEDYGFCRYWQKMGGKIWLDPTIDLCHMGRIKYQGNMVSYLQKITKIVN
jgi:hypothetical protein